MSDEKISEANYLLNQAKQALIHKDRLESRRLATAAARIAPEYEDPWLMLAALAKPHARVGYLKIALKINPSSLKARRAMHHTIKDIRSMPVDSSLFGISDPLPSTGAGATAISHPFETYSSANPKNKGLNPFLYLDKLPLKVAGTCLVALLIMSIGLLLWGSFSKAYIVLARAPVAQRPEGILVKPSLTPTSTNSPTPTLTPSPSPFPTATQIPPSPTTIATEIVPTAPLPLTEVEAGPGPISTTVAPSVTVALPEGIQAGDHWIEINLTQQTLHAFEGDQQVRSFIVSTGTAYTPTVTGEFRIYVKYETADMYGPGYYLPAVPSVMYFYKDYGIHGAYWHMNFGTPMSHGCVNMKIDDAAWVFNWASVGTLVYIHD